MSFCFLINVLVWHYEVRQDIEVYLGM